MNLCAFFGIPPGRSEKQHKVDMVSIAPLKNRADGAAPSALSFALPYAFQQTPCATIASATFVKPAMFAPIT